MPLLLARDEARRDRRTALAARLSAPSSTLARPDLAAQIVATIATYMELMKLRLVALLVLVAVTSAIAAARGIPDGGKLLQLALAGMLASCGAGALNHYFERDLDARMARTRARPLPAGRLRARNAAIFGLALLALALIPSLALGPVTTVIILLGAAIYVGVYTLWLKPNSPWSVVIGGLSGTCATLAGWSIGGDGSILTWGAFWSGLTLFLWSPPHFWCLAVARRDEYAEAGFPALPVVAGVRRTTQTIWTSFLLTVASALALGLAVGGGLIYMLPAALLGGALVLSSIRFGRAPAPRRALALFGLSMTFMAVSYVALALNALLR